MVNFSITIVFFALFILQFQPATLDEGGGQNDAQNHPEKPLFSKVLMDTVSLLRKSHKSSWEKMKTVIHDLQMQFSPPNLEGGREVGEENKGTFKDTFEESAETAAKAAIAVERAIHKTAEKKMTTDDSENESKAEL
ncbi:unnamed protein product [Sphenostylis stenocarpa]|uniref:Uncharacterized protein n=1 Tax=Sphenostylis stenocarpa TaxID=92480 RepID=A0AA86SR09_9FABA|nr:unnamed protein product [Sphenostylis stenocarpa]